MLKRRLTVPVFGLLAIVVTALVLGAWLGNRSPYGTKRLKSVEAVAKYEDPDNGLGLADAMDSDEQFTFNVHEIAWSDGSTRGDGDPPCLKKPGKKVSVEIGYLDLAWPDGGGAYDQALWIRCP